MGLIDFILGLITLTRFSTLDKNNDAPIVAFEDIPTDTELYPCVTFYSSSPGEKVRITSMVMQGAQRDLGNFLSKYLLSSGFFQQINLIVRVQRIACRLFQLQSVSQ